MFLRKLNGALLIVFIIGLLVDGGYFAYTHFADNIIESSLTQQLGGE